MQAEEYTQLDAVALAQLIETGEVTTAEVTEAFFEAHAATAEALGAVVETFEDARDRRLEELPAGPVRGVPLLIKDIGLHFEGRLSENASRLCRGIVSEADDNFGRLIKASGVNLVGRTNTPEFSMAMSADNLLHGTTSNPWRSGYSPGGSSGGAAAAVAAGVAPLAHTSDIGGSTRGPAAWCGTVGLHPSRGRVSAGPVESESGYGMAQSSVVSRSVRDTAVMLDAISVPQPGDPFVIARPSRPYQDYLLPELHRPLRIGWSADPLMDAPVDPEIAAAVARTAQVLEDLGHQVTQAAPDIDLALVDDICLQTWFHGFDAWLDDLARETGRAVGPDTVESATLMFYEFARRQNPADVFRSLESMNDVRRAVGPFFTEHDLWLSPSCAQVAAPNGTFSMNVDVPPERFLIREDQPVQFLTPYNVTGQPAISLPLAQHSNGLPIGIQLGARHSEEHLLIGIAAQLEEALPWADRRPLLHVLNLLQKGAEV